jgi:small redox-active disulfide protein 2
MLSIKILGSGCANCNRLEENTRRAVADLAAEASIDHVREMPAIMAYGVMRTPALVVNEKVVVAGRVPSADEVRTMLGACLG